MDQDQTKEHQGNKDNLLFLHDSAITKCLQQEVEFLKSSNMDLLVDPKSLYDRSSGGEEWNEAMAFLGHDEMKKSNKKN